MDAFYTLRLAQPEGSVASGKALQQLGLARLVRAKLGTSSACEHQLGAI